MFVYCANNLRIKIYWLNKTTSITRYNENVVDVNIFRISKTFVPSNKVYFTSLKQRHMQCLLYINLFEEAQSLVN